MWIGDWAQSPIPNECYLSIFLKRLNNYLFININKKELTNNKWKALTKSKKKKHQLINT